MNHSDFNISAVSSVPEVFIDNGTHAMAFNLRKTNTNMFTPSRFVQQGTAENQAGDANPPWAWEDQIMYKYGDFVKITGDFDVDVLNNPYFPNSNTSGDCSSTIDLTFDFNGTIDPGATQYINSITVEDGVELTIDGSLLTFNTEGYILVKNGGSLIIDNSVLKLCEPQNSNPYWKGIILEPNASINIINNSIIMDSRYGVVNNELITASVPSDLSGESLANLGGNSILVSNSIFKDNAVGLYIEGSNNTITIKETTSFDNCSRGVFCKDNTTGTVDISESIFKDNFQSIYLLRNGSSNSIFANEFLNTEGLGQGKRDINLNYTEYADIQQNRHENSLHGLEAINSATHVVNGNEYINCTYGVKQAGTHPLGAMTHIGSTDTEANYFEANYEAIDIGGVHGPAQSEIINNYVEHINIPPDNPDHTIKGIIVDGENTVSVQNNTVKWVQDGIFMDVTGDNSNQVNCNAFEYNTRQDLTVAGSNRDLMFLQNDFESYQNDGNITLVNAEVNDPQGRSQNPSDNCFEISWPLSDIRTDASTMSFDYFHFTDACLIPQTVGNYNPIFGQTQGANCNDNGIGSSYTPPSTPDPGPRHNNDPWFPVIPTDSITGGVNDQINYVILIGGDDPTTYNDETDGTNGPPTNTDPSVIYDETVELENWIGMGIDYALSHEDYAYGENMLLPLKKWKWQKVLCGYYIRTQQYQKALTFIGTLPQNTDGEIAFKNIQMINLNRLMTKSYVVNKSDKTYIQTTAEGDTPSSGYARALYFDLYGIWIPVIVPRLGNTTIPRSSTTTTTNSKVSPNPTNDILNVVVVDPSLTLSSISLSDPNGKIVKEFSSSATISMQGLNSGVYMLVLYFNNGTSEAHKIIKL